MRGRAAILWRRWRVVVGEAASRPPPRAEQARRGPARRHVFLLGVGAGEEAVGAEQLPAERADALPVAHPPPQARRAHRLRLAPGAPQRYEGPVLPSRRSLSLWGRRGEGPVGREGRFKGGPGRRSPAVVGIC